MNQLFQFLKDEKGATAVEYSLIAAAIAAVIITVVYSLGGKVLNCFESVEISKS